MEEKETETQSVIRSIRFTKKTYDALKCAADRSGVPFATYLKEAALAYMQAASQHEDLMLAIDPQNPVMAQKTFFDSLHEIRDVLTQTLVGKDQALHQKIDRLQAFIEAAIFYQMHYLPRISPDKINDTIHLAKERMKYLREQIEQMAKSGAGSVENRFKVADDK